MAELPAIGAVLISHGHCDHLDYRAIQEIDSGAKRFFVPLGVKAHLQRWGVRRNTTLWGGYAIKSPGMPLYFSADSGFGKHFSGIISKYAPFDFVMIENGACPGKSGGKACSSLRSACLAPGMRVNSTLFEKPVVTRLTPTLCYELMSEIALFHMSSMDGKQRCCMAAV